MSRARFGYTCPSKESQIRLRRQLRWRFRTKGSRYCTLNLKTAICYLAPRRNLITTSTFCRELPCPLQGNFLRQVASKLVPINTG